MFVKVGIDGDNDNISDSLNLGYLNKNSKEEIVVPGKI